MKNMKSKSFEEYIKFLRENFGNLIEYKELTGNPKFDLNQIEKDLFNEDPFVVFGASLIATAEFSDNKIYH